MTMRKIPPLAVLFLTLLFVRGAAASEPLTVVDYLPSDAVIANPERGIYHYMESRASEPNLWGTASFETTLPWDSDSEPDHSTMLYCIFYLDLFVSSDISPAFLDHITANLDTVREAGRKCVLRFAYTDVFPDAPPYNDATKTQVLAHIAQLKPVLQANADVIALMQAGFIGIWGEWYYTDHFVDDPADPGVISAEKYTDRRDIITAILDALPPTRMTAVRYPLNKMEMFGTTDAITLTQAHDGSDISRVGGHNDCFINAYGDYGTYRDWDINLSALDRGYWADESRYTPMGGETCIPDADLPPDLSCDNVLAQLAQFHWSYLNVDFYTATLEAWDMEGCFAEIQQKLGYRFQLEQGTYADVGTPGALLPIELTLSNQGWAAPYNPRDLVLILRSVNDGTLYPFPINGDPRFWVAESTIILTPELTLPATLPSGDYELLLHLPAPEPSLADNPAYAIQLANQSVWEAETGVNNLLHTVSIAEGSTPTAVGLGETTTSVFGRISLLLFSGLLLGTWCVFKLKGRVDS